MRVLYITSQLPASGAKTDGAFVQREITALQENGVEVDTLRYEGGWNLGRYLTAIRKMRHHLATKHYDLIHARFGQCGLVARAQLRCPIVITYGGSDVQGTPDFAGLGRYKNYILVGISRILSILVDEVIVVAQHLGHKLFRKDFHVIPTGIDLDLFVPHDPVNARQQLGLPLDSKLVLFAANPSKRVKRFHLAEAACEIASRDVELQLITLSGKPSSEVPLYMSACDVLLLTSVHEGSPNVVKEALACNLPIVTVEVGDVRERLQGIEGCAICEADTPSVIADGLVQVLKRSKRLESREFVRDLDITRQAHKIVSVYQHALTKRSTGK